MAVCTVETMPLFLSQHGQTLLPAPLTHFLLSFSVSLSCVQTVHCTVYLLQPGQTLLPAPLTHFLPSFSASLTLYRLYTVYSVLYLEAVPVLLEALPAVPGWHLLPLLLLLAMVRIVGLLYSSSVGHFVLLGQWRRSSRGQDVMQGRQNIQ